MLSIGSGKNLSSWSKLNLVQYSSPASGTTNVPMTDKDLKLLFRSSSTAKYNGFGLCTGH